MTEALQRRGVPGIQAPAALSTCTRIVAPSSESQPRLRAVATIASHCRAQSPASARGSAAARSAAASRTAVSASCSQVQRREVVDVHHPCLGMLVGPADHLDDH